MTPTHESMGKHCSCEEECHCAESHRLKLQLKEKDKEIESYQNLVELNLLTLKLQEDKKEQLQSRIKEQDDEIKRLKDTYEKNR